MPDTLYLKVLGENNESCHGGDFDWTDYLPTDDGPGKPLPVIENPALCVRGYHWTDDTGLMRNWAKANMRVYVAEPTDDVSAPDHDGKSVSSGGRLLREYELPQWWLDAMRFVNEEIPAIPWLQPDGAPLPGWRVFPTWAAAGAAAGAAARAAAGAAARAAAGAAAVAAWDAAARDAARVAARKAARVAAHGAAGAAAAAAWDAARGAGASWGVAGDFAWSAAKSAALHVDVVHVCSDLPLDQEYIDLARNWWHVWQKGYGLYADVNGVLYVHEGID